MLDQCGAAGRSALIQHDLNGLIRSDLVGLFWSHLSKLWTKVWLVRIMSSLGLAHKADLKFLHARVSYVRRAKAAKALRASTWQGKNLHSRSSVGTHSHWDFNISYWSASDSLSFLPVEAALKHSWKISITMLTAAKKWACGAHLPPFPLETEFGTETERDTVRDRPFPATLPVCIATTSAAWGGFFYGKPYKKPVFSPCKIPYP